jgi:hypothetical protein
LTSTILSFPVISHLSPPVYRSDNCLKYTNIWWIWDKCDITGKDRIVEVKLKQVSLYTGGDKCDITGKDRIVEVKLK